MDETGSLGLRPEPLSGFPGGVLLRLSGKGGNAIIRELQETLQPLLAKGTKYFLFDCKGLEFFNSAAFGYLTNLSDSLQVAGGRVALCRVPMNVQVAFEYMGLKDFFLFFENESEAARTFRESHAPKGNIHPGSKDPQESAVPGTGPESPSTTVSYALPAWLEDVDEPSPPPLDHPRWSALLQTVLRRLGPQVLARIPRRANVPPDSPPSLVARAILRGLQSPEELLDLFDERTLGTISRLFDLPDVGPKEELSQALVSFVHRTNTASLANFVEERPQGTVPTSEPVATFRESSLEMTSDSILNAIEQCQFPKLVKSERAARDLLFKYLARTFGRTQVTANRVVGRYLTLRVDLDVMERYGILVRVGKSVIGKKSSDLRNVEKLLGKVMLLAGTYGRGNLLVLLMGEIPKKHFSAVGELKTWIASAGGLTLQR